MPIITTKNSKKQVKYIKYLQQFLLQQHIKRALRAAMLLKAIIAAYINWIFIVLAGVLFMLAVNLESEVSRSLTLLIIDVKVDCELVIAA